MNTHPPDLPKFLATAIGSIPFSDTGRAVDLIFDVFKEAPYWPQLPSRSPLEDMNSMYAANLPGINIDAEKGSVTILRDAGFEAEVEAFYSRILTDDVASFALPRTSAAGFYEFLARLDALPGKDDIKFLKGHITGPITHGLVIRDEEDKPVIYDHLYSDIIVKNLLMQARFQVNAFENHLPHAGRIIFIDEPYLVSFGSAFVALDAEFIKEKINEIVDGTDAICGVHCCGRTDWKMLLETRINLLSFDAYEFMESLATYPAEVNAYLARGGFLSWGIVPSSLPTPVQIENEDVGSLEKKFDHGLSVLEKAEIDIAKVKAQTIITPSCGTGGMKTDNAEKTLRLTAQLAELLRLRFTGPDSAQI